MKPIHPRLREARQNAGFDTAIAAADRLGVSRGTYGGHEAGTRGIKEADLQRYAKAFKVSPVWLRYGTESPSVNFVGQTVPLIGYVGAGNMAHSYGNGDPLDDEAPRPPGATANTVALRVKGDSMFPRASDNDLIYYDECQDAPNETLFGKLCVVMTDDDRRLVKVLEPAGDGLFNLESPNAQTLKGVRVVWAARVTWIRPG